MLLRLVWAMEQERPKACCLQVRLRKSSRYGSRRHCVASRYKQSILRFAKTFKQADYTASYFFVVSYGLSKVSILLLITRLAVERLHQKIALYTVYLTGAWTFAALVALAARCGTHLPWNVSSSDAASQCINVKTFWIAITPVDVLIEIVIMAIPILMMIPVQVAVSKKLVIIFAFLFRLAVVASSIARLCFLLPYMPSADYTFRVVNADIVTQLVLCMSITTACIPCLKPFLDAFDSGQMAVNFKHGRPGTHSGGNSYPMHDLAYANNLASGYGAKAGVRSQIEANPHHHDDDEERDSIERAKYGVGRHNGLGMHGNNHDNMNGQNERAESASVASDSKSDQMIIKKDVQWTVSYEDIEQQQKQHNARREHTQDSRVGDDGIGTARSTSRARHNGKSKLYDDEHDEEGADDIAVGGSAYRHNSGTPMGYAV